MTMLAAVETVDRAKVTDPAFAQRFNQACDANPHCPPKNFGRLGWIQAELKKRGESVTQETVRKWLSGIIKPRGAKHVRLAEILSVDDSWLYLGSEPTLTPRERKVRNAMVDGVVNLVAGFIQMDGGHPAFPEERKGRAASDLVDLHAVIKGANYAFHVSLGELIGDKEWQFAVPASHEGLIVLGVIREGFCVRIVEMDPDVINESGRHSRGSIEVTLPESAIGEHEIKSFANRL